MAVQIRLSAPTAELDAAVEAVRRAFAVTSVSGRRRNTKGDPGERLHIVATGPAAAGATQPSPLAVAEDAKRSRDLLGELSVLQAADRDLKTQPWYPLQPGDVVLCTLPPLQPDQEPYGETYLADPAGAADVDGCPMLRMVSTTDLGDVDEDQAVDVEDESAGQTWTPAPCSFYELWFEAGASTLTIIRACRILHDHSGR